MPPPDAKFSFDGLDRALHEKARLGILTGLLAHKGGLSFGELKTMCGLTDGNLNRHLATLQEAGLVTVEKDAAARRPVTRAALTAPGRKRFLEYLELLEGIVAGALATAAPAAPRPAT